MTPETSELLERALGATDRESAWAILEGLRASLHQDPDVALAWATFLAASPSRRELREEAQGLVEAFQDRADIHAAAATALLAADERRPIDEPAPVDAPAHSARKICDEALKREPAPADRAALLRLRGNAAVRLRDDESGRADLEAALALDPQSAETLRDLGLCHMRALRWASACDHLVRAKARGGKGRALLFDLGCAATAAGEAELAAATWREAGMSVELAEGGLPFVADLRPVMLRVPTRGPGHGVETWLPDEAVGIERIWAQPLSPCHAVVRSPTFRDAIADFGDVVLFSPAPAQVIVQGDERVPVFPALGVLRAGDERRFRFLAMQQEAGQVDAMRASLPPDVVLYAHAERVEQVCPRCAAGDVLTKHEHQPPETHRGVVGKLVVPAAVSLEAVRDALETARAAQPGVLMAIPGLHEALRDTQQAGKHHKTWGAIERGLSSKKH